MIALLLCSLGVLPACRSTVLEERRYSTGEPVDALPWIEIGSTNSVDSLLEVEVLPARSVWRQGEMIEGKLLFRNAGRRKIERLLYGSIFLVGLKGSRAIPFEASSPSLAGRCLTSIDPGETQYEYFWVVTDPLNERAGFRLDTGRVSVHRRDRHLLELWNFAPQP